MFSPYEVHNHDLKPTVFDGRLGCEWNNLKAEKLDFTWRNASSGVGRRNEKGWRVQQ
jgi:hypothetical protein